MTDKYQNKYRISSARLQGYDYANAGLYFITICTANREHYFGKIINMQGVASMQLSEIGKIAKTEWYKTIGIRPDMNLQLVEFVVMPNHIHGIIIIGKNKYNNDDGIDDGRGAMHCASTPSPSPSPSPSQKPINQYKNKFAPQSKNLASIIRGYKSSVTKQARVLGCEFNWQSRFYDHIIRNENEFKRISEYIANNPSKWND